MATVATVKIPADRLEALREAIERRGLILFRVDNNHLIIRVNPEKKEQQVDRVFDDDPGLSPEEMAKKIEDGIFAFLKQ